MKDVHTEHCCLEHGCKYFDEDCTVTSGQLEQSFKCEQCLDEDKEDPLITNLEDEIDRLRKENEELKFILEGLQK